MSLQDRNTAGLSLVVLSLLTGIYAVVGAQGFRDVSRWFPMYVGVAVCVLAVTNSLWEVGLLRSRAGVAATIREVPEDEDDDDKWGPTKGYFKFVSWIIALVIGLHTIGVLAASILWITLFRRILGKASWLVSIGSAIAAGLVLATIASILSLRLPDGILIPSGLWLFNI